MILDIIKKTTKRFSNKKVADALKNLHPAPQSKSDFKNYHLGCGALLAENFLNVDGQHRDIHEYLDNDVPYTYKDRPEVAILQYDLSRGVPAKSDSLNVIYHSHFLEHLPVKAGRKLLEECFRVLKQGGLMRIAVPDFKLWCTNYVSNNSQFFDWYKNTYINAKHHDLFPTKASIFSEMLYNGHFMAYDFETLSAFLTEIGFKDIREVKWGESSKVPSLDYLEAAQSPRRNETLIIECAK